MIEALIGAIIFVVVAGLIYWLVMQLPLPGTAKIIVQVLFIIILILVLLGVFVHSGYWHYPR